MSLNNYDKYKDTPGYMKIDDIDKKKKNEFLA